MLRRKYSGVVACPAGNLSLKDRYSRMNFNPKGLIERSNDSNKPTASRTAQPSAHACSLALVTRVHSSERSIFLNGSLWSESWWLVFFFFRVTLGNQLEGVHLVDPDVVDRFKGRYPDGNVMKTPAKKPWWSWKHRPENQASSGRWSIPKPSRS